MGEFHLPEHVLSDIEEQSPWDMFVIADEPNISVGPRISFLDEVLPEELEDLT
jgi:hypothetical protein